MEETIRRLAETVPLNLFIVAGNASATDGLIRRVEALHANVSATTAFVATLRAGGAPNITDAAYWPDPLFGTFPAVLRELADLNLLHTNASRTFILTCAALRLDQGPMNPIWRTWWDLHVNTVRRFRAAYQRLRIAGDLARALVGAVVVAGTFPHGSPGWLLWLAVAQRLGNGAAATVTMLFHASRRFRDSAAGESVAAWIVFHWDEYVNMMRDE